MCFKLKIWKKRKHSEPKKPHDRQWEHNRKTRGCSEQSVFVKCTVAANLAKKQCFDSDFSTQEINNTISRFFSPPSLKIVTPSPQKQSPIASIKKLSSGKELFGRVSGIDMLFQNNNPRCICKIIESQINAYKNHVFY